MARIVGRRFSLSPFVVPEARHHGVVGGLVLELVVVVVVLMIAMNEWSVVLYFSRFLSLTDVLFTSIKHTTAFATPFNK